MKKRFLVILVALLVMVLGACQSTDTLITTSNITIPTTIAPTTAAPTTAVPTTVAPTAVPTTVAPTAVPTTVAPTTVVTPTTVAPTTTAPVVTTTTTAPVVTTSTTAPISTTITTTSEVDQRVTISFETNGGPILPSIIGEVGSNVLLPLPLRIGYEFQGWFSNSQLTNPYYSGVIPSSNITIYAKWTVDAKDYSSMLLNYIASRDGLDPIQDEEQIMGTKAMYEAMLGTNHDQMTYHYVVLIDQTMLDVMGIESLVDVQMIWVHLALNGMNLDMVTQTAFTALTLMISQTISNYDESWFIEQIADYEDMIDEAQQEIDALNLSVIDYCASVGIFEQACTSFFATLLKDFGKEELFNSLINQYGWSDGFDYWVWDNLEWNLHKYFEYNQVSYLDAYNSDLSYINQDVRYIYIEIGNAYIDWKNVTYNELAPYEASLSGIEDGMGGYITDVLRGSYFHPLREYHYSIRSYQWMIESTYRYWEEEQNQFEIMTLMQSYIDSPHGEESVRSMIALAYGFVDHIIMNLDPVLFDLVMNLVKGNVEPDLSPEGISGYIQHVVVLLVMMQDYMGQEEVETIKSFVKDLIGIYLEASDMTLIEQQEMMDLLYAKVDEYMFKVQDVYQILINILDSITPEKIGMIMEAIQFLTGSIDDEEGEFVSFRIEEPKQNPLFDQFEMVIYFAQLMHEIAVPHQEDLVRLMGYLVELKFDVETMFMADPLHVIEIRDAMKANLAQIFALVTILKDVNPLAPSAEEMKALDEVIARVEYLVFNMQASLDEMYAEDEFGYLSVKFETIIYMLHGWMPEELMDDAILLYVNTFGMSEEDTYYFLMSMAPLMMNELQSINSFASFRSFYSALATYGLDKATISTYLVNYIANRVAFERLYNEVRYLEDLTYYQEEISYYQEQIDYYIDFQNQAQLDAMAFINTLPLGWQPLFTDFWNAVIQDRVNYANLHQIYEDVINNSPYGYMWNSNNYYQLKFYLDMTYYYTYQYSNPSLVEVYQTNYLNLLNSLTFEERELMLPVLSVQAELFLHYYTVYRPLSNEIYEEQYEESLNILYDFLYNKYFIAEDYILNYQSQLYWMNRNLDNLYYDEGPLPVFDEFFQVVDYRAAFGRVVLAIVTRLDTVILEIDPITAQLLFDLVTQNLDPSMMDLSPAAIEDYANQLAVLLRLVFGDVNPADLDDVQIVLAGLLELFLISQETPEMEIDEILALFQGLFDAHVPHVFDSIGIIADFIDSITAVKVQIVMDQIALMNALDGMDEETDNLVRAVAMATIIQTLFGDESLDFDTLILYVIQLYGDVLPLTGNEVEIDVEEMILTIQTLIQDIILQAGIIDGFDPLALSTIELEEVHVFYFHIQELMNILSFGPQEIVEPVYFPE
jgi:uncharacterized repeat protein (TIGR02543 family)